MSIHVLVHVADDGSSEDGEELRLKSLLEDPIKDTKLPLGADVTVSRVHIEDFDECAYDEHNDCAANAYCRNTKGSYECECKDGYHDLSGTEALPGRVCSSKLQINYPSCILSLIA